MLEYKFNSRAHDAKVVSAQFDTFKPLLQDDESEVPCNDSKNFSYPKCVSEWIRKEYREVFRRNNRTGKTIKILP